MDVSPRFSAQLNFWNLSAPHCCAEMRACFTVNLENKDNRRQSLFQSTLRIQRFDWTARFVVPFEQSRVEPPKKYRVHATRCQDRCLVSLSDKIVSNPH